MSFFCAMVEATGNTFEQTILGARGVDTQDPENIEAVLSTQFKEFCFGSRAENFRSLLGYGIFTQDGADWKRSRDLLRPQFMQTRTKSFPTIQAVIEEFISALQKRTPGQVDLQPAFFRLTLDTTMSVLFGRSLSRIGPDALEREEKFAHAFDYAQHVLAERGRLGDLWWLMQPRKYHQACKTVHAFIDDVIEATLKQSRDRSPEHDKSDRYIFLEALAHQDISPRALRDQSINVLLAGRDTTACLLSWTLKLLAKHQGIQQRLRQEARSLPSYAAGTLPTPSELKTMSYLDNVLSEVLRLFPSVPINMRTPTKTTTLPVGGGPDGKSPIILRKGEGLGYSAFVMHRRKDIWGEDALEFRPSRWEEAKAKNVNTWAYIPFNGGPRVCLGQEFAILEAGYTVVRLLQSFSCIDGHEVDPLEGPHTVTLVIAPSDGCKVRLS